MSTPATTTQSPTHAQAVAAEGAASTANTPARTSTGKRRLSAIPTYRGTGTEATAAARTDPVDTPSISASGRRPRRCASVA